MTSHGELIWNGPEQHAFSFGVQVYRNEKVLVGWNGTTFPEPVGRGNGVVTLWNKHYEQIVRFTIGFTLRMRHSLTLMLIVGRGIIAWQLSGAHAGS